MKKKQVDVDSRNINGETPLVLAARQGKINHVKLLIENQVWKIGSIERNPKM